MAIATVGFVFHQLWILLAVVFGLGLHSALFGPIKYSIIPQHMQENELISANALVESGTFAAILLGTIGGGILSAYPSGGVMAGIAGMAIAIIGYFASRFIPAAPSLSPDMPLSYNLFSLTLNAIKLAYKTRVVFLSIIGISWFWLYGALLLSLFPAFVKTILMGDESTVTLLLSLFTVGIAMGSILCERLSYHTFRPSLVIIGVIGMTLAGIDFAMAAHCFHPIESLDSNPAFWHILIDLMCIGIFGGFYSVPLYALMQSRSDPIARSRVIAANNILNALFMVMGAIGMMVLLGEGWSISDVFLLVATSTGLVAGFIAWKIKKLMLRTKTNTSV
jgi:MFS family permease